ncbi:MAG: hypothetical protein P8Y80_12535, partial [Acidobacteriota bacterium]
MPNEPITERYTRERFLNEGKAILSIIEQAQTLKEARRNLYAHVTEGQFEKGGMDSSSINTFLHVVRDCARIWRGILLSSSEKAAGFSVLKALWDISRGNDRPDLQPAFYADMIHLSRGLAGKLAPLRTEVMPLES